MGWQEGTGNNDRRMVDTLFVKLINHSKEVCIPDLETNAIALTRGTKKTWCALNDDRIIQIYGEQIVVFPNFAMTDYASGVKQSIFIL